ncbi:MAG: 1-phosphofructokinase family hexose kinase [Novosphingobium sp.]
MKSIATLTLNPTIDVSYEVESVFHTHKMRALSEHYDPGGGGINVARVFIRLGGNARCYYLSGGATGVAFDGLVDLHQLARTKVHIEGETRVATAVFDRQSGKEYRVIPPGPTVRPQEWQECLDLMGEARCDFLVVSGSLPPGVPEDFYARVAGIVASKGIKVVLDSSGAGLREGLAGGGFHLVKPSQGELQQLAGRELDSDAAIEAAAMDIVTKGQAEIVAVTMGHRGGLLAQNSGAVRLAALPVEAKSAVGAGDSFLAAMVFGLASGESVEDACRFGMAAGAAAVITPGTGLAYPEDIRRLRAGA